LNDTNISLNIGNLRIDTLIAKDAFFSSNPERRKVDYDARNRHANLFQRFGCRSKAMRTQANEKKTRRQPSQTNHPFSSTIRHSHDPR
jgi:hypothetical protein